MHLKCFIYFFINKNTFASNLHNLKEFVDYFSLWNDGKVDRINENNSDLKGKES